MSDQEPRRREGAALPYATMSDEDRPLKEDPRRTSRDIRVAIAFGIIAATVEMGVLFYFFR